MWYKFINNEWLIANKVTFPNGETLQDNHNDSIDGWFWSDERPKEYVEYLEQLNEPL